MDKQIVINRLARICYRPKTENDDDYAVQLFIEALLSLKPHYAESEVAESIKKFVEEQELFDVEKTPIYI